MIVKRYVIFNLYGFLFVYAGRWEIRIDFSFCFAKYFYKQVQVNNYIVRVWLILNSPFLPHIHHEHTHKFVITIGQTAVRGA